METLHPQQLAVEGQAEYQKKEYLSAAKLYQAAAGGFKAAGDTIKAAQLMNDCSVAYFKSGNAAAALEAATGTDEVLASSGDKKLQAMALGNQAAALEKLNRLDEAMEKYEYSSRLLAEAGESELRLYVMQSISAIQLRKRHFLEAFAAMHAGIMGVKKPTFKQKLLKSLIQIPFKLVR